MKRKFRNSSNIAFYIFRDAIVIYRAPQFHNEFEPNFVRFTGNSFDELVNFVMTN